MNPVQQKVYDAVSAALPFAIDPAKTVESWACSILRVPSHFHNYRSWSMQL